MASHFVYRATLKHDDTVRTVSPVEGVPGGYVTASYDKTAKLWTVAGRGDAEVQNTFVGHTGWVVNAKIVKVRGVQMLMTAGWDKNLVLWDLETCQPQWMLDAHTDKVTCIAQLESGEIFTGGYDNMVVIWKDAQVVAKLKKHTAPVACCAALATGEAVSGGAHGDNSLIRWSKSGQQLGTYKGHTSGVRGVAGVSETTFISCSNDTTLILWSIAGCNALQTFRGHTNQVYSVAQLPTGEFASGSEDKTLKVWGADGSCLQTISMPSFVFNVTVVEGDLAAGCQDGTVRIFTRNPELMATPDAVEQFEETVASQKLNKGGLGGIDPSKIKGTDALNQPGTTDGQQLFVKSGAGVEVYAWNLAKKGWEKIGDVVDGDGEAAAPAAPAKVAHNGKEWDYVFDVDLRGDGSGNMKLPYNKGENPYEAAQRFIHANAEQGVHQGFLDEIARFIITNAESTGMQGTAQDSCVSDYAKEAAASGAQSSSVADNMRRLEQGGGGVAFSSFAQEAEQLQAGNAIQDEGVVLPQGVDGACTTFSKINASGMVKKLQQQAAELGLDAPLLDSLCGAVELLADGKLGAAAFPTAACQAVLQKWPQGKRFAVCDFLRQAVLHGALVPVVTGDPVLQGVITLFRGGAGPAASGAEEALCLKAACNLFATPEGRAHAGQHCSSMLEKLGGLWKSEGTPVRATYSTLLLNFARMFRSEVAESNALSAPEVIPPLCEGLLFEKDKDIVVTVIFALGCLAVTGSQVAEACTERAKKCFLQDTLRGLVPSNPSAATVVNLLKAQLREDL